MEFLFGSDVTVPDLLILLLCCLDFVFVIATHFPFLPCSAGLINISLKILY
jgi:hypothetical protein